MAEGIYLGVDDRRTVPTRDGAMMEEFANRVAPLVPSSAGVTDVRSTEGIIIGILEQALRVIAAAAHEDVIEEHACRALRRVRAIRKEEI